MSKLIVGTGLAALLLCTVSIPASAAEDLVTNGVSLNGISLNGKSLNGISLNRIASNGVSLNGRTVNDVATADGTVDEIVSVELPDGTVYTK